jgi:hypothetical protein
MGRGVVVELHSDFVVFSLAEPDDAEAFSSALVGSGRQ